MRQHGASLASTIGTLVKAREDLAATFRAYPEATRVLVRMAQIQQQIDADRRSQGSPSQQPAPDGPQEALVRQLAADPTVRDAAHTAASLGPEELEAVIDEDERESFTTLDLKSRRRIYFLVVIWTAIQSVLFLNADPALRKAADDSAFAASIAALLWDALNSADKRLFDDRT